MVKQYQDTGWNTEKTAATLYEYDSFGNQVKQTLALTNTPSKDNSPMVEITHSVEVADDGVFRVTTKTRYNAEGTALNTTQKQLISQFSTILRSKTISIDVRGNNSVSWAEYTAPAKVTSFDNSPTSVITAESIAVDDFTITQKDHVGIVITANRNYTASGMQLVQVDGRGNATTYAMDLADRTVSLTDATGATTTTAYDACHDQPTVITDAMGNTACYKYDLRGRKIAEWGTALQPACFGYDEADNLISLKTFRAGTEIISSDPSERMDGDETTWAFDPATGLELRKTYADNSSVVKTYDRFNRLAMETDARGIVKTHSYEITRGLLLGTTYSDGTTARLYAYNHLGQLTQVSDDAGIRRLGYNAYGEQETDTLLADEVTHLITETRDAMGRSTGFTYAKNGTVQHTVTTGYGEDGRVSTAGFMHGGSEKQFGYGYLSGTNLLQTLTMPCNMTLTQSYESQRNLLTNMTYHRSSTLVTQRTYSYDTLGRPLTRSTARNGQTVNDCFVYNSRSELSSATVNGSTYGYDYDNIGNRTAALEASSSVTSRTEYTANELNQYTSIQENEDIAFVPTFDADGNQTLVKTSTGIWNVEYNAENRPIRFTDADGAIIIECSYDFMGRRATKKLTTNGSVTLHQRYIYRGYLQIAACDLTRTDHPCLWLLTWDPTQPIATRPLAIQKDGTWYTYGWDLTKNVCEVFGPAGYIRTAYIYAPYGAVSSNGNVEQPVQWNSEFNDTNLDLTYYNHRYYNAREGRWTSCDVIEQMNLYTYCYNQSIRYYDYLGLIPPPETHGGGLTAGGDTRTEIYNSYQEDGRNQEEASDYLKGTLGFFKLPLDSLELFDAEIKKTQQLFRKTGCKFVITYARHGNKSGEKFDTVAVLEEVKKVINNNLNDAIYITSAHEYQIFNNALKSVNCICGVVFIGHAGSTDGPSRLIFDNKTSIATEDRPKATGRFSYKTLYNKNLVTDNLSLLLGCRSASDKRFITKQNKEIVEIEGKYMSIAEAIGIHFQGRVIGSFEKLNFDGGNPYTPIRKGGSDFRLFNSSK